MSENDFLAEFGDVKPLAQDKVDAHSAERSLADKKKQAVLTTEREQLRLPLTLGEITPVKPDDFLSYQQPGIQDGVFKNLRLGKYNLDGTVVLTNMNLESAAHTLFRALNEHHSKGHRALLIRHGTGEKSKPFPALKKSYLNRWLHELEIVIAFHTAQPFHGGLGSTYALLKKNAEQKLINREQNKRG